MTFASMRAGLQGSRRRAITSPRGSRRQRLPTDDRIEHCHNLFRPDRTTCHDRYPLVRAISKGRRVDTHAASTPARHRSSLHPKPERSEYSDQRPSEAHIAWHSSAQRPRSNSHISARRITATMRGRPLDFGPYRAPDNRVGDQNRPRMVVALCEVANGRWAITVRRFCGAGASVSAREYRAGSRQSSTDQMCRSRAVVRPLSD
jgi:hypothetical protein